MAFHKDTLGSFGGKLTSDMNGYVPTADTTAWELSYDHGTEKTHDSEGNLTQYGQWWEDERFPEIKKEAMAATSEAEEGIADWQDGN